MKKLHIILVVIIGLSFGSCNDNQKKKQVNDETKEVGANPRSEDETNLEEDENYTDETRETDTTQNE